MRPTNADRTIAQVLIVLLGAGVLVALFPFASGLLGGAVLYVVLHPLHERLAGRLGPRGSAALLVTLAAIVLALPGVWLVDVILDEGPRALRALAESRLAARLSTMEFGGVPVGSRMDDASGALVAWSSGQVVGIFGRGFRGMLDIVIALFGLFYLLLDGRRLWARVVAYLPFSRANAELLRERFVVITDATLLGTALTAVLQGTIVGFTFALLELPNPPFWGTVTAFVSVLPVLGSALVWIPGAIALLATGHPGRAATLVTIGIVVVSNVDNVARLMVNRKVARLHPMATLVGAFAGVPVFGISGVLLGPLAISYFLELLSIYEQEYGGPRPHLVPSPIIDPAAPPRTGTPLDPETVP
jgi:predicted PurR-regulated permease PerM